jgi:UDP-N-acetylglucosamine--N-acetylmuramyl-(pentapeptide) pyrophosphoryl-undecaprenol N-acetylglucosamine transferase
VVFVAALRRIPTMLLEQNAVPGLTNRLLARLVRAAAVTYEASLPYFTGKGFVAGNPVRAGFFEAADHREAIEPRVLVVGGSQGAHAINVAMMDAARELARAMPPSFVVHQTGERDVAAVRNAYREAGLMARVEPYLDRMDREMQEADLIVCRAGATTLAELAAAGRPALLIPFPHATHDHQRKNAAVLADAGAAAVLEQAMLNGPEVARHVLALTQDAPKRAGMATAMRRFARPDAARVIVDRAAELMGQRP